jgi:phosphatidylserine/phosphatidylglycerophosphate/cardiolipin synthase-like enzyme
MRLIRVILVALLSVSVIGGVAYAASTSKTKGADLEWAFTKAKQQPEKLLISVIDSSKSTLDVAIYSLTKPDIVDAIKKAKKRGVNVRIISDKLQSAGKTQAEALKILGSAGIPIKVNSHSGLMHLKVVIADKKIATTGSYNYSANASTDNDEVLMVIRNATVAKSFSAEFDAMWKDTKGFKEISPKIAEPSPSTNESNTNVTYKSCEEVKSAGKAPLQKGDPGYSTKLDRDGDGVACEK